MNKHEMSSYSITVPDEHDFAELTEVWDASVRSTHDFLGENDIRLNNGTKIASMLLQKRK